MVDQSLKFLLLFASILSKKLQTDTLKNEGINGVIAVIAKEIQELLIENKPKKIQEAIYEFALNIEAQKNVEVDSQRKKIEDLSLKLSSLERENQTISSTLVNTTSTSLLVTAFFVGAIVGGIVFGALSS